MSLELKVGGLDRLQALIEKAPEVGIKQANATIQAVLTVVDNNLKKEAPRGVTGKLRSTFTREFRPLEGTIKSGRPYAQDVEYGTKPHTVPYDEIAPWAKLRGLSPWAVIKSIEKKGTKANPFFQRALDNSVDRVNVIIKGTINNIIEQLK